MRIWQFILVVFNFNFLSESKFIGAHYDILLKHGVEKCKTNPSSIACPAFILASFLDYQKFSQAQVRCHFLCSKNSSDEDTYMRWYNVKQRFLTYYEDSENIESCIQRHYGGKYPQMSIGNMLLYLNTPLNYIHRYFYEVTKLIVKNSNFKNIAYLRLVELMMHQFYFQLIWDQILKMKRHGQI